MPISDRNDIQIVIVLNKNLSFWNDICIVTIEYVAGCLVFTSRVIATVIQA